MVRDMPVGGSLCALPGVPGYARVAVRPELMARLTRGRRHRREAGSPGFVTSWSRLRGRAGNRGDRRERRIRVLRPALHTHVACARGLRRRWANGLICSLVEMRHPRAGQRTKGQARCRGYREDSLPHPAAPSVKDIGVIGQCTPSA
jgi:hypothetical protein